MHVTNTCILRTPQALRTEFSTLAVKTHESNQIRWTGRREAAID
jgi:hypothetical protein